MYTAIHKETGKHFTVIGKDSIGILVELKDDFGITTVSNAGYYDFYKDGKLIGGQK